MQYFDTSQLHGIWLGKDLFSLVHSLPFLPFLGGHGNGFGGGCRVECCEGGSILFSFRTRIVDNFLGLSKDGFIVGSILALANFLGFGGKGYVFFFASFSKLFLFFLIKIFFLVFWFLWEKAHLHYV